MLERNRDLIDIGDIVATKSFRDLWNHFMEQALYESLEGRGVDCVSDPREAQALKINLIPIVNALFTEHIRNN